MENTIVFQSSNFSFDWVICSNTELNIRMNMETRIVLTSASIEENMDWSDVDEPMETNEMEFEYEMDCLCRMFENLRISH